MTRLKFLNLIALGADLQSVSVITFIELLSATNLLELLIAIYLFKLIS